MRGVLGLSCLLKVRGQTHNMCMEKGYNVWFQLENGRLSLQGDGAMQRALTYILTI